MKRATAALPPDDARIASNAPIITLPREDRYRRRVAWMTDCGQPFLLDLPEATYMPDGTGLALNTGEYIIVRAAPENLIKLTAPTSANLMRIAWHIGNRHTPAEITPDALFILPDHVLVDMVRGLGGTVEEVSRPFEPEGGAYGGHGTLERGHHHRPVHQHDDHEHGHNHTHHHHHHN